MPRISNNHFLGRLALSNVTKICTEANWICEQIIEDYGEDLSIQMSFQGVIDSFRVWIQVKGLSAGSYKKNKNGDRLVYFDRNHLNKWQKSIDLVIIVLYCPEDKTLRYCLPQDEFAEKYFDDPFGKRGQSLKFTEENSFDIKSIKFLEWTARIRFYENLISIYIARELADQVFGGKMTGASMKIAMQLAIDVGLVDRVDGFISLNVDLWSGICNVMEKISLKLLDSQEIDNYIMLKIIGHLNDFTGVGVPYHTLNRLVECVNLLAFDDLQSISKTKRKVLGKRRINSLKRNYFKRQILR